MSVVAYNGVTLPYATINRFDQQAVYDDTGGVDRIYTKIELQCQCTINANYLAMVAPDLMTTAGPGSTDNPALIMQAIRQRLLRPRRTLSVKFNGVELIPQKQLDITGSVDAKNGPQPQSCLLVQLTNVTFLMIYTVVAHYWENNTIDTNRQGVTNQRGNPVLYNRWTETQDIDGINMSTLTREGKFIIRTDAGGGRIVDRYRDSMAILGVPVGFLRRSASYTVAPDGLGLQYRVVDQEVFQLPPEPAYEASGEYTESCTEKGAVRYAEARVKLKGDRSTPSAQIVLIEKAIGIGMNKIFKNNGTKPGIIQNASIRMSLYENEVEFMVRSLIDTKKGIVNKISANVFDTSVEGSISAGVQRPPIPYPVIGSFNGDPGFLSTGTAAIIQAAAYYDPNLANSIDPATRQLRVGRFIGAAGTAPEV